MPPRPPAYPRSSATDPGSTRGAALTRIRLPKYSALKAVDVILAAKVRLRVENS